MKISKISPFTDKLHVMDIDVTPQQLAQLQDRNGPSPKQILPNLSIEEREFLMTGITQQEWDTSELDFLVCTTPSGSSPHS